MNIVIIASIFFFGAIIGSFLNVCIDRIPNEESIAYPPSHCGNCKTMLKPWDMIPLFSWLLLGGKCRYCKSKVSVQYFFMEVFTGILFLFLYLKFGFTYNFIKFMAFTSILLVIAIIDFKTQDVYDSTIVVGIVMGILFLVGEYLLKIEVNLLSIVLGAVIPGGILFLIAYFTGAMGFGDSEIIFLSGLFLGFKLNLFNLFLSIVIGGMVAIILMITKKKGGKEAIAFGPYIALSSYLVLFIGHPIINWYLNMFF